MYSGADKTPTPNTATMSSRYKSVTTRVTSGSKSSLILESCERIGLKISSNETFTLEKVLLFIISATSVSISMIDEKILNFSASLIVVLFYFAFTGERNVDWIDGWLAGESIFSRCKSSFWGRMI